MAKLTREEAIAEYKKLWREIREMAKEILLERKVIKNGG